MMKLMQMTALLAVVLLAGGCARQLAGEDPDSPNRAEVAEFTPEDIEASVGQWMQEIQQFGPIAESKEPQRVAFCTIRNMGREHIEMTEFERAFKYWGLRNGKIRFTAATDLPPQFFEQHKFQKSVVADKETAVQVGKIQGWRYAIYGDLYSKATPDVHGNRILYYEVYVYMLDIQTGEEVWNGRKKFKLRDTKPTFGW